MPPSQSTKLDCTECIKMHLVWCTYDLVVQSVPRIDLHQTTLVLEQVKRGARQGPNRVDDLSRPVAPRKLRLITRWANKEPSTLEAPGGGGKSTCGICWGGRGARVRWRCGLRVRGGELQSATGHPSGVSLGLEREREKEREERETGNCIFIRMRSGLARLISLFLLPPPLPNPGTRATRTRYYAVAPFAGGGLRQGTRLSWGFRRQPRVGRAVVGQGDRAGHRCSVLCKPQRIWCNKPGGLHETLLTSGTECGVHPYTTTPHTRVFWRFETQNMGPPR
ncbi:hypothetical protein VTG60DRAFT_3373 [Thermothelomyces hinnuleus]